jgi:GT2 family glycosyltransferase
MASVRAPAQGVDVIIPVYGNLRVVRRCVESVLAFRTAVARVLVIDDASPDGDAVAYLRALQACGAIDVIRHEVNKGVVAAANTGFAASRRDVVLLNSDTEVHSDWAGRLLRCAYAADNVGTVTPFSNDATICSYPFTAWYRGLPGGMRLAELDDIFARENDGEMADVPTGISFCLLIRRACLDEVGPFDEQRFGRGYGEETDFCQRARLSEWRNVLCADTFVYHETGGSFGDARQARAEAAERVLQALYPDYATRVRDFMLADSLRPLRERVDAARAALSAEQAAAVMQERAMEKAWLTDWLGHVPPFQVDA